jgi:hypothetical protein
MNDYPQMFVRGSEILKKYYYARQDKATFLAYLIMSDFFSDTKKGCQGDFL